MNRGHKGWLLYTCAAAWFLICIYNIIIRINQYNQYDFANTIAVIGMGIFPISLIVLNKFLINLRKNAVEAAKRKKRAILEEQINEKINNLQAGLPLLHIPNIFLGDAQLHFYENAKLINTENKMVGLINEMTGSISETYPSLLHEDWERYRTRATGSSKAIYNDITNYYEGQLALTSKNIIFINQQKGFEIDIDQLSFIQDLSNGISIQNGNNVYVVLMDDTRYFFAILNIIRNKCIAENA